MIFNSISMNGRINLSKTVDAGDTILLLNFNGTNGQTTTVDSSGYNHPITLAASSITTSQSVFGGSSLNTTASQNSSYLASGVQGLETEDFTLEGWVRQNSAGPGQDQLILLAYPNIGGVFNSYDLSVALNVVSGPQYRFGMTYRNNAGTLVSFVDTTNISLNTWYHWALTRQSGTLRFFRAGTLLTTVSGVTRNYPAATWKSTFNVNVSGNMRALNGYHDSVRIVKGAALYTGNFTPPVSEPA